MQDRDERYKEFIAQNRLSYSSELRKLIQEYEAALEGQSKHNISEGKTMSENLCDSRLKAFKLISEVEL